MTPDKIPGINAHTDMPISDSCNCCQECNVSCCFPRRIKKHKKHNPERRDSIDENYDSQKTCNTTTNKTTKTSKKVINKK